MIEMVCAVVGSKMKHELSSVVKELATKMAEIVLSLTEVVWDSLEEVGIYLCAISVFEVIFHVLGGSVAPAVFTVAAILDTATSKE